MLTTQPGTAFGFSGPLYAQVAALLRSRLSMSFWTPAAPLPNEAALAKEIGVSIGTVRKALEMLEDERLITRRQGRGTFVIDQSKQAESARFSSLTLDGFRIALQITQFSATLGPMPAEAASALNVFGAARAVIIDMRWRSGEAVTGVERIVAPAARFPGLEAVEAPANATLFHVYRRDYHTVVHRVAERLSIEIADAGAAGALGAAVGEPVLRITRVARTRSDDPVEWSERRIRLGAAKYEATLG